MKKTWLTVLVVLIFFGLLALLFGLVVRSQRPAAIHRQTILELDFERGYPENLPFQSFTSSFMDVGPTLRSVAEALDRAANDDRVVGVVARVGAARAEQVELVGAPGLAFGRECGSAHRSSGRPALERQADHPQ